MDNVTNELVKLQKEADENKPKKKYNRTPTSAWCGFVLYPEHDAKHKWFLEHLEARIANGTCSVEFAYINHNRCIYTGYHEQRDILDGKKSEYQVGDKIKEHTHVLMNVCEPMTEAGIKKMFWYMDFSHIELINSPSNYALYMLHRDEASWYKETYNVDEIKGDRRLFDKLISKRKSYTSRNKQDGIAKMIKYAENVYFTQNRVNYTTIFKQAMAEGRHDILELLTDNDVWRFVSRVITDQENIQRDADRKSAEERKEKEEYARTIAVLDFNLEMQKEYLKNATDNIKAEVYKQVTNYKLNTMQGEQIRYIPKEYLRK